MGRYRNVTIHNRPKFDRKVRETFLNTCPHYVPFAKTTLHGKVQMQRFETMNCLAACLICQRTIAWRDTVTKRKFFFKL